MLSVARYRVLQGYVWSDITRSHGSSVFSIFRTFTLISQRPQQCVAGAASFQPTFTVIYFLVGARLYLKGIFTFIFLMANAIEHLKILLPICVFLLFSLANNSFLLCCLEFLVFIYFLVPYVFQILISVICIADKDFPPILQTASHSIESFLSFGRQNLLSFMWSHCPSLTVFCES